jgi:hypothetical protein
MKMKTKVGLAIAFCLLVLMVWWRPFGGVYVTVRNSGTFEMSSVTVHVTGREYKLRNLKIGDQKTVRVRPIGDSHVEISYKLNGENYREKIDCYFCPENFAGTISVEMADGEVVELRNEVGISAFW